MKKFTKIFRDVTQILTLISLFVTVDFGFQFLYNLIPGHDGYAAHGLMQSVFHVFGDHDWTLDKFFSAFEQSAWLTVSLLLLDCSVGLSDRLMSEKDG